MSKGNQRPHSIKDNARTYDSVNVKLPDIFHGGDSPLVIGVDIVLQPTAYLLQCFVDNANDEVGMIPLKIIDEHCEEANVAMFDLPRTRTIFV